MRAKFWLPDLDSNQGPADYINLHPHSVVQPSTAKSRLLQCAMRGNDLVHTMRVSRGQFCGQLTSSPRRAIARPWISCVGEPLITVPP